MIIVDTVKSDLPPGTLRVYDKAGVLRHPPSVRVGPHDPGVKEALLMLEFAGRASRDGADAESGIVPCSALHRVRVCSRFDADASRSRPASRWRSKRSPRSSARCEGCRYRARLRSASGAGKPADPLNPPIFGTIRSDGWHRACACRRSEEGYDMRTCINRPAFLALIASGSCTPVAPVKVNAGDQCFRCRRIIPDTRLAVEQISARTSCRSFARPAAWRSTSSPTRTKAGRCSSPTTRPAR